MRNFLFYLDRFRRDQSGAFLVLFGVMALVLTALAGAVVDYTRMEERRNRAQIALDSAALALQPDIYNRTPDQIRADAERLVMERAGEGLARVWVDGVDVNTTEGSLTLSGGVDIPMMFVRLVGVEHLTASITSQSTRQKLRLEVALVLDNSGSMDQQNRMSHLKLAALNAVDILLEGQQAHPDTFIGVVPYTYQVNVGANQNNPFWWIDRGESRISGDNFIWDARTVNWIGTNTSRTPQNYDRHNPDNSRVDRVWLYNQLRNESWRGCVEARPYPLDVRDVPPARTLSDLDDPAVLPAGLDVRETLFVPYFAPDVPDRWGSGAGQRYGNYTQYLGDNGGQCSYLDPNVTANDQMLQMRICKYINTNLSLGGQKGPNGDCGQPIVPLTNERAPVRSSIQSMVASGGTNIHLGAMWGWRLLSPNEPFASTPYDDETAKVMILMTDGENTYYRQNDMNGSWFYSAYGHPVNNQRGFGNTANRTDGIMRMGKTNWTTDAQFEQQMDSRLAEVCVNAKSEGIQIYTIGLAVDQTRNPAQVRQLLRNCATNPQYAYFTNNPADLDEVFASIAGQLAALRLSR